MLFTAITSKKPSRPFHLRGAPSFFFFIGSNLLRRSSLWSSASNRANLSVVSIEVTARTAFGRLAPGKLDGGETIQQRGATPARAIQDYSYRTRASLLAHSEFEAMWQIMPLGPPESSATPIANQA
jgi:hypothetical protein